MNISTITGRLVSTPELRKTTSRFYVTDFTVAVKNPYDSKKAIFIDCVAWKNTANFITQHFEKGSRIEVTGMLVTETYTDKNGSKQKRTKINVERADFGGDKKPEETNVFTERACEFGAEPDYYEYDVPFMED